MPGDTWQGLYAVAANWANRLWRYLGARGPQRALRYGLFAALLGWSAFSLVSLGWSLWPMPSGSSSLLGEVLNPQPGAQMGGERARERVDLDQLSQRQLFGQPQADAAADTAAASQSVGRAERDALAGIEENARETRLALRLNGVVSSTDEGYGFAMIEHQSAQALYAVGDSLPVGRAVRLAKVLPARVVIDNAGTYELLTLFEPGNALGTAVAPGVRAAAPVLRSSPAPVPVPSRTERSEAAGLAAQYRERLYSNPQSLAEAVRVAAVRDDGQLIGYRVSPGSAGADFASLGFEPGDVVTAINGLPLSDPANTMRLYQTMRSASEAVFDIRRDGQMLSLSVRLPAAGDTP